jgi:hypothetical protein
MLYCSRRPSSDGTGGIQSILVARERSHPMGANYVQNVATNESDLERPIIFFRFFLFLVFCSGGFFFRGMSKYGEVVVALYYFVAFSTTSQPSIPYTF